MATTAANSLNVARDPLGFAWVGLTLALAVHVADEAAHDFLAVYNPIVRSIRQQLPWLPLPVFTFPVWLTGLILAVLGLLALAPLAFRGNRRIAYLALPYAVLMLGNGLLHIAYSVYERTLIPGVWSSPLLLATAAWLLVTARRTLQTEPSPKAGNI